MPRIEIIPAGWETSKDKADGNGTPTVDVCKSCATGFTEGETVPADIINDLSDNEVTVGEDDLVGSTDVEHPPYDEDEVDCDCCGNELNSDDE